MIHKECKQAVIIVYLSFAGFCAVVSAPALDVVFLGQRGSFHWLRFLTIGMLPGFFDKADQHHHGFRSIKVKIMELFLPY
jgi:hypothetical protein